MKQNLRYVIAIALLGYGQFLMGQSKNLSSSIVDKEIIFQEKNGLVAVEAEFFYKQTKTEVRAWYRTSKFEEAKVGNDKDKPHVYGASNNAYLEILPDTRVTHDDELKKGENFSDKPGALATIHYKINFENTGRYYVWARALSTGAEDNGLHVGLNGEWLESGQRMQWCKGKHKWTWGSSQRTKEVHCGILHNIYIDIKTPGIHEIQFSMREDGFEFDKFILTKDKNYTPKGVGPKVNASGKLPKPFAAVQAPVVKKNYFKVISRSLKENKWIASQDFPSVGTNFYKNGKNWMAINPNEHKSAISSTVFKFDTGTYDVVFVGVGENDGSSTFQVFINGKEVGTYQPPVSKEMFEEGKDFTKVWKSVQLTKGDKITVTAKIGTDGKEFTRGRWAGLVFTPKGKGKKILVAPTTYTQD